MGPTLLEASQLVKLLEEKLGVSAAAATVAVAAAWQWYGRQPLRLRKRPNSRSF